MLDLRVNKFLIYGALAVLIASLALVSYKMLVYQLIALAVSLVILIILHTIRKSQNSSSGTLEEMILFILVAVFLLFYLWTASTSLPVSMDTASFGSGRIEHDHYNMMSHAFKRGSLSILFQPDPGLLALPDPYDHILNRHYRQLKKHSLDFSLYKGKYYLYFGPVPALTILIPYSIIFGYDMPRNLAAAIFCIGGTLFSILIFNLLVKQFFPDLSLGMRILSISALCLCNICPFNLRRPLVYEIAISSGFFFMAGGLFILVRSCLCDRKSLFQIAAGSLFLGLAAGSRPNLVLSVVILFFLWGSLVDYRKGIAEIMKRDNVIKALCIFTPFLACIAAICLYNYLRFGSIFEFGLTWQLTTTGTAARVNASLNASVFFRRIYDYLFSPLYINGQFPFFHCTPILNICYFENIIGIIPGVPFVLLLLLYPLAHSTNIRESRGASNRLLSLFILLGFLLFLSCCATGVVLRYETDFMHLLVLSSLLIWCSLGKSLRPGSARILFTLCITAAIIYSIALSLALSIEGDTNDLRTHNPGIYNSIEKLFIRPACTLSLMQLQLERSGLPFDHNALSGYGGNPILPHCSPDRHDI